MLISQQTKFASQQMKAISRQTKPISEYTKPISQRTNHIAASKKLISKLVLVPSERNIGRKQNDMYQKWHRHGTRKGLLQISSAKSGLVSFINFRPQMDFLFVLNLVRSLRLPFFNRTSSQFVGCGGLQNIKSSKSFFKISSIPNSMARH